MTGDSIHVSMQIQIKILCPVGTTESTSVMVYTEVDLNGGGQCGRHLLSP